MSESPRIRWQIVGLLAFVVLCLAVFLRFFGYTEERLIPRAMYTVEAVLDDAGGMAINADVRQAGIKVGRVRDISVRSNGAVALLELADEHAPVYRDAEVLVREKTPVGERYIELSPGTPQNGALASGEALPRTRTRETVSIDDALSAFASGTRRDLRRVLRDLGGGLDRHGSDLNRLLEASTALVEAGGPVAQVLRGEREQVARLVDDFGRVMGALGDRERDIRLLARQARIAGEATADRADRLGEVLRELPPTVRQARGSANRLGSFSELVTPTLGDLRVGFETLVPAIRELAPAARAGRRIVAELGPFARRAAPLLGELDRFSRKAASAVPPLGRFLGETGPMIEYLEPYAGDIGAFFTLTGSAADFYKDPGNVLRVAFLVSEDTWAGAIGPEREAYQALIGSGLLSELRDVGINPYPDPGTLGKLEPFEGSYPRVEADE